MLFKENRYLCIVKSKKHRSDEEDCFIINSNDYALSNIWSII